MYTNTLDRAVGGTILEYKHVAYADDHLTVVGLAVPGEASHEMISALVRGVVLGIRDALDTATRSAGCCLNLTKSEVILADPSMATDLGAKTEFTWLGYSLKITQDHRLMFTETKMLARFKRTLGMVRSVFQYVSSLYVRWRIYKVYISPIIDWYLPVIAHKPRHALAQNNSVESFQHQLLALVTGASTSASTKGLEQVCEEPPVSFKLRRLCSRLDQYVFRNPTVPGAQLSQPLQHEERVLRSGVRVIEKDPVLTDRKDFGDNIYLLAKEFASDTASRDKYVRNKGRNREKRDFDIQGVQNWVKTCNSEIQRRIRQRIADSQKF